MADSTRLKLTITEITPEVDFELLEDLIVSGELKKFVYEEYVRHLPNTPAYVTVGGQDKKTGRRKVYASITSDDIARFERLQHPKIREPV